MRWAAAWSDVLNMLCPMHVMLDAQGIIRNLGPTLGKLRADRPMLGQPFLDRFDLVQPSSAEIAPDLSDLHGRKIRLRFADHPQTALKGQVVLAPAAGGTIVNLAFGISILEAVQDYALTSADFAATDPTTEMLFLVEAKSAAMEASRRLNLRLEGARIAAEEQAYTDTLTGLKNRRALDLVLARLVEARVPFGMMHVDLDHFKSVNDTLGHGAGDHVLQHVARVMIDVTRRDDTVARIGGDEFVLVFEGLTNRKRLSSIADRLIDRLQAPIPYGAQICRVSCSVGTVLSIDYATPEIARMFDDADVALYASKNAGRARHTPYSHTLRGDQALRPI
ncbi:MAG: GGDEF domain-containing protein [Rhodobacteraceae bacterium]|nr:GGDEF domain-containing protein [Paracoccaceae bacterium]